MADRESQIARGLLNRVDRNVVPKVKENLKVVTRFSEALQKQFQINPGKLLRGAHIMHSGSAYEGLIVSEKTDFDILVVLNDPFLAENFVISHDPSGFFTMKWKKTPSVTGFSDREGYLLGEVLQKPLFEALGARIRNVNREGVSGISKINIRDGLASLAVELHTDTGTIISIDLVPQIPAVRWGQCADLVQRHRLPPSLRTYIQTLEVNSSPIFFFSVGVPGRHQNQRRLLNISFSMLEKEFLISQPKTRDMVRLVKLVGKTCEWKRKCGLKSFYIKRVAVKYTSVLNNKSLWNGYKILLAHISDEVKTNRIDGFFIENQDNYTGTPENVHKLIAALDEAGGWTAEEVHRMVQHMK